MTFVVALLIMIVVMPSALNLPQSNPQTVLEYAPIPPEDDDPPPPDEQGSLSSLGLGTSDTIATEGGPDVGDIADPGTGERPSVKRCVGDPARQTEDPNSPPCVPFFEGDNGGATFRGVTGDEIRVLVYKDAGLITLGGDSGYETTPPTGTYCDVDKPENSQVTCLNGEETEDYDTVQQVRALSRHFNERYQTYGRKVHFYIYWAGGGDTTSRRSDAQDNLDRIKPFAVIDSADFHGNNLAYIDAAAKRKMSVYGNYALTPNKIYRQNAPYMWSFWPDLEHMADMYHDYVCTRVAPFPVSHSGNSQDMGKPRKYGLLSTTDSNYDGVQFFAELMRDRFKKRCPNGQTVDVVGEYTYPRNGYSLDTHPDQTSKARENIQLMKLQGVTTILWLGGYETETGKAAAEDGWLPEWVLAGDLTNDQIEENRDQDQRAWRHAWLMSNALREDKPEEAPCRMGFREAEPEGTGQDEDGFCGLYRSIFMLFRGIQVAGPFLTPEAVDEGNHSLARKESNDPFTATCFFDPGDYSCVKDAHEAWWDPDAPDPEGNVDVSGCWRLVNGGLRHIAGSWPKGDEVFQLGDDTPCNNVGDGGTNINPYGPAG